MTSAPSASSRIGLRSTCSSQCCLAALMNASYRRPNLIVGVRTEVLLKKINQPAFPLQDSKHLHRCLRGCPGWLRLLCGKLSRGAVTVTFSAALVETAGAARSHFRFGLGKEATALIPDNQPQHQSDHQSQAENHEGEILVGLTDKLVQPGECRMSISRQTRTFSRQNRAHPLAKSRNDLFCHDEKQYKKNGIHDQTRKQGLYGPGSSWIACSAPQNAR